ncbi:MAG: transporter ATP-binding protein [Chloroflexi bacterium]|jgi:branched-chain amino acid transport system ATP-binding protein|nr:transporter ATP-binding protein [Chloroflexota bacterium]
MLEVKNLSVNYGSIEAVRDISFQVPEGKIVALIGANGAGKTTTLSSISGLLRAARGTVIFQGKEITRWPTDQIVRAGLAQVAEGRAILSPLTVAENLELGAFIRHDRAAIRQDLEKIYTEFPRLAERRSQLAGSLSGGEQQMLAIGRALMAQPKMLLMDEPSMGLAPIIINQVFEIIKRINLGGTTVLLVEQNANKALKISDYAYVMEHGEITFHGPGEVVRNSAHVVEAFLGKG